MVTIPAQFNGPDRSGNGGYVSGLLAGEHGGGAGPRAADEHSDGIVTSTLRQPPPLDTPLTWERDDSEVRLVTAGGAIIGSAVAGSFSREPVPCPTEAEAVAGLTAFAGFDAHPFARCFTCGTDRAEGEGMRLFAGPLGDGRTATPWSPHPAFARTDGALDLPLTWASLDCPGGWAVDFNRHTILLGRMTGQVLRHPRAGEDLLATGRLDGQDGRKFFSSTALYSRDGELLGRAEQTWIELAPAPTSGGVA